MSELNSTVRTRFLEDVDGLHDACHDASASQEDLSGMKITEEPYQLTWRSWLVVLVTCFAQMAQVFVVVGSGQILAFISRDLGDANLAGWIVQGPLLMQSVLSPIVGRLSDVSNRKWLVAIPPLIAMAGAIISATAKSMPILIAGGVLLGVTLSTISILQTIPSEVLPRKYRAIANGAGFLGSAVGGIFGSLGAGAVTNSSPSGWRYVFWIQVGLHATTFVLLAVLYNPSRNPDKVSLGLRDLFWAIDPVGSGFFMAGTTLTLLALNWAPIYGWSNMQVLGPLCVGIFGLLSFSLYEWKGRSDGILAHVLFRKSPNFVLANFAFAIEGWLFYGAINSIVPQIILNLGFDSNAWTISVRQLSASATSIVACLPVMWYATRFKDLKTPLLTTFGIFLSSAICYSFITPSMNAAQIGFNILVAVGQAGPLILLVAIIQLAAPHRHLSTATGLAFSVRAIGGAFGSAVLDAIINGKLDGIYTSEVGDAAMKAGLPRSSLDAFLKDLSTGQVAGLNQLPGSNQVIANAATNASRLAYAQAYRLAWKSTIPFVVLAMIAVFFIKDVKGLMTDKVEATVELPARLTREKEQV